MEESIFYGIFFSAILFNYIIKLRIEKKGNKVGRNSVREGIIAGLLVYFIYQAAVLPEVPFHTRIIDSLIGLSALAAGAVFFIKGKLHQGEDSPIDEN